MLLLVLLLVVLLVLLLLTSLLQYAGPLYNVTRSSDGTSFSVPLLSAGGFANKVAHDKYALRVAALVMLLLLALTLCCRFRADFAPSSTA